MGAPTNVPTDKPVHPGEPNAELSSPGLYVFHLTGEAPEGHVAGGLPAALLPIAGPVRGPLLLPTTDGGAVEPLPLIDGIERAMDAAGLPGDSVLRGEARRMARALRLAAEAAEPEASIADLYGPARERFVEEFDVSEAAEAALRDQLDALGAALPAGRVLAGLGVESFLQIGAAAARRAREEAMRALEDRVRALAAKLHEILRLYGTRAGRGAAPETLGASLGDAAEGRMDAAALSRILPEHRGPQPLSPERRERIAQTLAVLEGLPGELSPEAAWIVVHDEASRPSREPAGVALVPDRDPISRAIREHDERAARLLPLLRAMRVASLEARDAYRPDLHDGRLARFGVSDLGGEERRRLHGVVVLASAETLRAALGPLLELLASGRPVCVLAPCSLGDLAAAGARTGPGSALDLARVAIGLQVAAVWQTSCHEPGHVAECLARALRASRPSLVVFGVPSTDAAIPESVQLAAAHLGRLLPLFRYDPDRGETWAERFDVEANPEPTLRRVEVSIPREGQQDLREVFTPAHAVAALGSPTRGILRIAREAWAADQVPLGEYLDADTDAAAGLPYVSIEGEDGRLDRAIVSRELTTLCRERLLAWRAIQELGGVDNEHARRAAAAARAEAGEAADAQRRELEESHREEVEEVRSTTAAEAIDRLVAALMQLDLDAVGPASVLSGPPATSGEPASQASPPAAEPAAPAEPAAADEDDDASDLLGAAYIDSALCTTCNDCININPKLFRYNGDKQAEIADLDAGTFEELVLAAEKCPARCIHPGTPRDGDPGVTDELLQRASAFR
jgi:ferredoxin